RHWDEMARELGCSLRALKHRLEYGKKLLQKRLTARGVTMTGLMLSLMLSPSSEAASVPPALAAATLRAVVLFLSGQQAAAASQAATHLAGQVIRATLTAKIRSRAIGITLALALVGGGLGVWQVVTPRADPTNLGVMSPPMDEAPPVPV